MASKPQYNQLAFTINPPGAVTMPSSMAIKFNTPQPIFFQKLDSGGFCTAPPAPPPANPLRFSAVSEQSLTEAMRLAKFDLQRQRDDSLRQSRTASPESHEAKKFAKPIKGKTKIIQSRQYKDKVQKRQEKKKKPQTVTVTKRDQNLRPNAASTQTQSGPSAAERNVMFFDRNLANMPAAPQSPPVRDRDPLGQGSDEVSSVLTEIHRLREQMEICFGQVQRLTEAAKQDAALMPERQMKYEEDIASERKRQTRAEEQTARSSRTVYQLAQQVRLVQEDISKMPSVPVRNSKKVALLNKVAALHRSALRALQTFVQHLPDFDVGRQGLPRVYVELGLVTRQLSLCCAQIEVSGQASLPESVANLLREVQEYQAAIDRGPPKSPPFSPRMCQASKVSHNRQNSSASKRLEFGREAQSRPKSKSLTQKRLHGKEKPTKSVLIARPNRGSSPTPTAHNRGAVDGTPDRQAVLKAGIAALARAAHDVSSTQHRDVSPHQPSYNHPVPHQPSYNHPVPPLNLPRSPRNKSPEPELSRSARGHGSAFDGLRSVGGAPSDLDTDRSSRRNVHKAQAFSKSAGVIISNHQKTNSSATNQQKQQPYDMAGYAEPTLSSRAKKVEPHEWPEIYQPPSPRRDRSPRPRSNPASPRSPTAWSPHNSFSSPHSTSSSPRFAAQQEVQDMRHVNRQVRFDRHSQQQSPSLEMKKKREKQRVENLRRELGQSKEWLSLAERQLESKLHPILKQAEETASDGNSECDRHLFASSSEDLQTDMEMDADILADSMLGDMLEETLTEISQYEVEQGVGDTASALMQAPSINNLLHRLQEIEIEQQDVRTRWASIVYDDPGSGIPQAATYYDGRSSDHPSTPPPIEMAPLRTDPPLPSHVAVSHKTSVAPGEAQPIYFTKAAPLRTYTTALSLTAQSTPPDMPYPTTPQQEQQSIKLILSRESLKSIHDHRDTFEKHLKQTGHGSVGRFDPWQIVEQVADEIMSECLSDIAGELETINNDIVDRVCGAEFSHIPSGSSRAGCPYRLFNDTG